MRYVAAMMILYAAPMVLSGSLELGHDLLHYLAEHHHTNVHDHDHHGHHAVKDHGYGHVSKGHAEHVETETSEETRPSLILFFLFIQPIDPYNCIQVSAAAALSGMASAIRSIDFPPLVPPPWFISFPII